MGLNPTLPDLNTAPPPPWIHFLTEPPHSPVGLNPIERDKPVQYSALNKGRIIMIIGSNVGTILLVVLILGVVGALPTWPHSKNWGYYPSSGLGLVAVILLILVLMGRI